MTEVITIRKELAERLMRLPISTHESVTALTHLRRTMERQKNLQRTSDKVEPILVVGELKWGCSEGSAYYVQCRDDLPEHVISTEKLVMPVAQHYRIMDAISEKHKEVDQSTRSNLARQKCINYITDQIINAHPYEMTGSDFDYETPTHNKIRALLTERDNLRSLLEEVVRDTSALANKLAMAEARLNAAKEALTKIAAIEDEQHGGDWDEIEEARNIANTALTELKGEQA